MKVHDQLGLTPISYQPAYLDPVGRKISFSFRKLFFAPPPVAPPRGPQPQGGPQARPRPGPPAAPPAGQTTP